VKRAAAVLLFLSGTACAVPKKSAPAPASKVDLNEIMIVNVDVADVRAKPGRHLGQYVQDPDQETQVLRGEPVIVHERDHDWVRVECPQQPEFTHHNKWEGYPGWMEIAQLTKDRSAEIPVVRSTATEADLRHEVLEQARRHLGMPYLWGGRSLHDPGRIIGVTGVDCSGLVNWAFRQVGIIVPRDAAEQYMKARKLEPGQMHEGDLIFLARADQPDRIVHVAFYAGTGRILEAPQSGESVHEINVEDRFGTGFNEIKSGDRIGDRVVYFGTLFGTEP